MSEPTERRREGRRQGATREARRYGPGALAGIAVYGAALLTAMAPFVEAIAAKWRALYEGDASPGLVITFVDPGAYQWPRVAVRFLLFLLAFATILLLQRLVHSPGPARAAAPPQD